jgi:hypothetical protein
LLRGALAAFGRACSQLAGAANSAILQLPHIFGIKPEQCVAYTAHTVLIVLPPTPTHHDAVFGQASELSY